MLAAFGAKMVTGKRLYQLRRSSPAGTRATAQLQGRQCAALVQEVRLAQWWVNGDENEHSGFLNRLLKTHYVASSFFRIFLIVRGFVQSSLEVVN